ncbi:hypothetical protein RAS1_19060 [Phycisphaerae bacterium RAS1]|nr:hypothetical protein RAS1_19060 [Phycisphaerae bacterium RAS1]
MTSDSRTHPLSSTGVRFVLLVLLALSAWWMIWGRLVRVTPTWRTTAATAAPPIRGAPIDSVIGRGVAPPPVAASGDCSPSRPAEPAPDAASSPGSAAATSANTAPPAEPAGTAEGGYRAVSFDLLAGFQYASYIADEAPEGDSATPPRVIPPEVETLHDRKVDVTGFMIPIELEKDRAKSFLLVKDRLICCFGRMPKPNEWIFVEMEGRATADMVSDVPATVRGTIEIREEIRDGVVMGLYNMKGESVTFKAGF